MPVDSVQETRTISPMPLCCPLRNLPVSAVRGLDPRSSHGFVKSCDMKDSP